MFGKKKKIIKALEEINDNNQKHIKELHLIIERKTEELRTKEIVTYTLDAISFAKELQKYPKRNSCGGGRCGSVYQIPTQIIDKIANQEQ